MFRQVNSHELKFNPFKAIGEQWMLVTAGDETKANTMTASWGGAGILWNKDTVTCYIRPQRYTREFLDAQEYFSLSFLPSHLRDKLTYCGIMSGRNEDKIAKSGLTLCHEFEAPCFAESDAVFICKKLYVGEIKPENMLSPDVDKTFYAQKDYHLVYIGEIVRALLK